jgi:hypothetical protein
MNERWRLIATDCYSLIEFPSTHSTRKEPSFDAADVALKLARLGSIAIPPCNVNLFVVCLNDIQVLIKVSGYRLSSLKEIFPYVSNYRYKCIMLLLYTRYNTFVFFFFFFFLWDHVLYFYPVCLFFSDAYASTFAATF